MVKNHDPKKTAHKHLKITQTTENELQNGFKKCDFLAGFWASGHPWKLTGLPEVAPKAQGGPQEAIWIHFGSNFHTDHFNSIFPNISASIFIFSTAFRIDFQWTTYTAKGNPKFRASGPQPTQQKAILSSWPQANNLHSKRGS